MPNAVAALHGNEWSRGRFADLIRRQADPVSWRWRETGAKHLRGIIVGLVVDARPQQLAFDRAAGEHVRTPAVARLGRAHRRERFRLGAAFVDDLRLSKQRQGMPTRNPRHRLGHAVVDRQRDVQLGAKRAGRLVEDRGMTVGGREQAREEVAFPLRVAADVEPPLAVGLGVGRVERHPRVRQRTAVPIGDRPVHRRGRRRYVLVAADRESRDDRQHEDRCEAAVPVHGGAGPLIGSSRMDDITAGIGSRDDFLQRARDSPCRG